MWCAADCVTKWNSPVLKQPSCPRPPSSFIADRRKGAASVGKATRSRGAAQPQARTTREVIAVSVGGAGNSVGTQFWEDISIEHGIDPTGTYAGGSDLQLECVDVYYREEASGRYAPRAVIVDLEPGTRDSVLARPYGGLFSPSNFVFGQTGSGNNWAKGHYTEGAELIGTVLDVIRKEAEASDALEGIQLNHAIGGGTGGGLGTLLISKFREEFGERFVCTFSIAPSPKVSDTVTEPYNAVLSFIQLVENVDATFMFDEQRLYDVCFRAPLNITAPTYRDLNQLTSGAMAGITTCVRFPTALNFRDVANSLLTSEMFRERNKLGSYRDAPNSKYLAAAGFFRGGISAAELDEQMLRVRSAHSSRIVNWIPNNIQHSHCEIPARGLVASAGYAVNSTGISTMFGSLLEYYSLMLRRRSFLHWYTGNGMEEAEFGEAQANMNDLIGEYLQAQDSEGPPAGWRSR
ncbi:hypothetical protein EMIHUDRAFT_210936 [Emiliania huxleyi CCMP1516]|uniref:Tubulin/FtsZ GTPase domain-containing protein n=2 Tax=Emiliania huxleyi TaxID=2903 RepID=A0A0D3IXJ1_EMIH1|nr:hypothetical protein EMIHUDRAFT_210936 [Emiliania huxleyi CCMP1516]EOD15976.1 hypothetical protein EMIHUDRAFT_210936 [Emiliania huxleyi CCMP1516]|eukprot:XP_005768405.1 hypothetical protein EMIHUDRAFT_210936 [Emiliania huxleyi CCMP1516]